MAFPSKIFGAVGKLFRTQGQSARKALERNIASARKAVRNLFGQTVGKVIKPLPPGSGEGRVPKVFGSSIPTGEIPEAVSSIKAGVQQEQLPPEERYYNSDLERFLYGGQIVNVESTHVEWVQWIEEAQTLYIGYHGGKGVGVIAVYQYFEVNEQEAEAIYNGGTHSGTKVWDDLRLRGTVFGHKKAYSIVAASSTTYSSGFGGYHPRYLQDPNWEEEHAKIPESGAVPAKWKRGEGPYSESYLANQPVQGGGPIHKPSGKRQRSQRGKEGRPWWYG